MGDFREAVSGNGVVLGDKGTRLILEALLPGRPDPWGEAERATREIIKRVQPTFVSDERRRGVIGYVQRILKECLGCEVFPFGSVPLKTYLPDGDIDLTAFDGFTIDEPFANHVYAVLEAEDRNRSAEFVVKDVQYIRAEVKLVKCLVQNIVVDISFNQLGGLCTLCFLEEVDRLIGKDHLFKRSIILIKAWCYYESRILGAHHGLISTYALETLVLYIFHLFHSSLNGPLAVLYKFLDYFSNFDWENFCVSLTGPVHVSSLPEIVAERPENGGSDLLLSDDFLRECIKKFSVPSRGTDTNSRTFIHKHLNIVDPLKENNNLGRSVSKGNFFRIRSAFAFGARKLGRILLEPEENIVEEVRRFFTNTLHRHGTGPRPDVLEIESSNSCNGYGESRAGFGGTDLETLGPGKQKGLKKSVSSTFSSVSDTLKDETSTCSDRLSGDAEDLATSGIELLRMSSDNDARLSLSSQECKSKPFVPHAPHLYFSHSLVNGQTGNEFDCSSTDNNTRERQTETARNHESLTPLQDLSGDFEGHLINLQSGRWWYDHVLSTTVPSANLPVSQPSLFQRKSPSCPWDASRQSVHFGGPAFFPMSPPVVPGVTFPVDELPKTRGTGMYFPITNHDSYRERTSPVRGRTQAPLRSPRSEVQSSIRQGGWKQSSPRGKFYEDANGFAHVSEREVHFGSVGPVTLEDSSLDSTTQPDSSPRRDPRFSMSDDRHAVQSYRLKDEDFPPL